MKKLYFILIICAYTTLTFGQAPTAFECTASDGFGYYISSATSSQSNNVLTYSNSRISKITTSTGNRVTLCTAATIGTALNGMAFNPHDNFLYAVSRYDASKFSGKLYRIGGNCQKVEIPVTGAIVNFAMNNINTVDAAGGNISSGTFDLDNHYYVNTSFTNIASTGFTNKLQKLEVINNTAVLKSTVTLTCPSCTGKNKLRVTDIIFDEVSGMLLGSNEETHKLYSINSASGVLTEIGATGVTSAIIGMYKNQDGNVRAISANGNIYSVNIATGNFTLLSTVTTLNSSNADAASGCYAPPRISGRLYLDANGLTDNIVNGTGTNMAGTTVMYANLVQNGLVVKSDVLSATGFYQFMGLFSGTYEVQISSMRGTDGQAPPAQNLPNTYQWVGDNIGAIAGNDGSPNGKQTVIIAMGQDKVEVNFGIDGKPITSGLTAASQQNPNGIVQVVVPNLTFSDPEEPSIGNITIMLIPNPTTLGTLYYNSIAVTPGQYIPNYVPSLLKVDPVDGNVTVSFTFITTDMAGVISNESTVFIPFTASSLPIELSYFTGRHADGVNILEWSTASEVNSDHFSIERRTATGDFEEIGSVNAQGNTSSVCYYSFTDKEIVDYGYYRLLQVDQDGKSEYSDIIGIRSDRQLNLSVYPTVAQDYLWVDIDLKDTERRQFVILNVNSQIMQTGEFSKPKNFIEIDNLNRGTYFIQVLTEDNIPQTIQFIKL